MNKESEFTIVDRNNILPIQFNKEKITFSRNLDEWNESNTVKYEGISIAEIQLHNHRTFKFRFIIKNLLPLVSNNR